MFGLSKSHGFTLIELMVVIAIIGVLGAIAIPAYKNYTTKSKFSEVVVATAALKNQIAVCLVAGECVKDGAPSLGGGASAPKDYYGLLTADNNALILYAVGQSLAAQKAAATGGAMPTLAQDADKALGQAAAGMTLYDLPIAPQNFPDQDAGGYMCVDTAAGQCGALMAQINAGTATLQSLMDQGSVLTKRAYSYSFSNMSNFPDSSGASETAATNPPGFSCVGSGEGCSTPTKYVASVFADAGGVITATAASSSGLNGETFVLIPQFSGGRVDWLASGSCKTRAGGALC